LDHAFAPAVHLPRAFPRVTLGSGHEKMETPFRRSGTERARERERERRAMWPRPVNDCIKVNERGATASARGRKRAGRMGRKGTGGGTTDERGTHSA